jgi:2',3'-cyclic-nucleotide 2'-phosphodiesterase/3'-nucleotidase/5'-nucleotidase
MRFLTSSLAFTLLFLLGSNDALSSAPKEPRPYAARVVKVTDGDTIQVLPPNAPEGTRPTRIRMINSDTPEVFILTPDKRVVNQGYWGTAASDALKKMVKPGDTVGIQDYGIDMYGRVLGRVLKKHGKATYDLNLEMVYSGWALLYVICDEKSCDLDQDYYQACRSAASGGRGIFNPKRPLPQLPFVFRSIHQERPLHRPVGNRLTKKLFPERPDRPQVRLPSSREQRLERKLLPLNHPRFEKS